MTTPEELAAEVAVVVELAQERVGPDSIGAKQYFVPGKPQKFETMTMDEFFVYMEEESLDIVNYGVMLTIKIERARTLWRTTREAFGNVTDTECGQKKFLSANLGWVVCAYEMGHEGGHSFDELNPF